MEELETYTFTHEQNQSVMDIVCRASSGYSSIIWPSSLVLSKFIFHNQKLFQGKSGIEIGAGSGMCGIMAAKIGAKMTLTDSHNCFSDSLLPENVALNNLEVSESNVDGGVVIRPLTWGITPLTETYDFILASDCFYEKEDFENILATVALIIEENNDCVCYTVYHVRNADWNIECLLKKWKLNFEPINMPELHHSYGKNSTYILAKITANRSDV